MQLQSASRDTTAPGNSAIYTDLTISPQKIKVLGCSLERNQKEWKWKRRDRDRQAWGGADVANLGLKSLPRRRSSPSRRSTPTSRTRVGGGCWRGGTTKGGDGLGGEGLGRTDLEEKG